MIPLLNTYPMNQESTQVGKDYTGLYLARKSESVKNYGCFILSYYMLWKRPTGGSEIMTDAVWRYTVMLREKGIYASGTSKVKSFDVARFVDDPKAPPFIKASDFYRNVPVTLAEMVDLENHLRRGLPAVLEVDAIAGAPFNQHFVLAVGIYNPANPQIVVNDPIGGKQMTLAPLYGRTNAQAITRIIYYGGSDR